MRLCKQGPATVAPLSVKRLLERVRVSLWKSCGCARIVVLVDSVGMDQVNDALAFRRVHGNDKEIHQDVFALLTQGRSPPRPGMTEA